VPAVPVIHLIRHAQASFGAESYDVLSELGERQARLLDEALAGRGVRADRVVVGGLRRQADTAKACPRSAPGEPVVDARWDEYDTADVLAHHGPGFAEGPRTDMGAPAGLDSRAFQDVLDVALTAWQAAADASPCAETWPAFQRRALAALDDLAAGLRSGEHALVFSSGGTIAAICMALLGAPPPAFLALNRVAVNSGATKIMVGRGGARLATYNDHSHLEHDRALMSFR